MIVVERFHRAELSFAWQKDGKYCAAEGIGGAGAHAQSAAVLLYEFAGDPKPETCSGIFFRSEEWLEDAFQMLGRNAETSIRDGDANATAREIARV